jgi:hypothetical protein
MVLRCGAEVPPHSAHHGVSCWARDADTCTDDPVSQRLRESLQQTTGAAVPSSLEFCSAEPQTAQGCDCICNAGRVLERSRPLHKAPTHKAYPVSQRLREKGGVIQVIAHVLVTNNSNSNKQWIQKGWQSTAGESLWSRPCVSLLHPHHLPDYTAFEI